MSSVSSAIPRWQDVGSNIVGGRCALVCFAIGLLLLTLCVCVCVVQGKYEFRNFVNTKTTRREVQIRNILTALGDKEYTVRYSDKTRPAPLPLFRVRRHVKACVCVCVRACVCVCVCVSTPYTHVGLTGSVAIMKEHIFVTRLHVLYTVLQKVAVVRDTKSSKIL